MEFETEILLENIVKNVEYEKEDEGAESKEKGEMTERQCKKGPSLAQASQGPDTVWKKIMDYVLPNLYIEFIEND